MRMAKQKSVIDWADRYDKATKGFFDYDKKRNGRFTADASGGFSGEIDVLIKDFDKISERSLKNTSLKALLGKEHRCVY